MNEMIERVARAVRKAHGLYGNPPPSALRDARIAIEEMRKPTHDMLKAAEDAGVPNWYAVTAYPAMIDAALSSHPAEGGKEWL